MRYMGVDIDHIDIWRKPGPREHTCLYQRGGRSYDDPTANEAIGRVAAEELIQKKHAAQVAAVSLERRRKRLIRIIERHEAMERMRAGYDDSGSEEGQDEGIRS